MPAKYEAIRDSYVKKGVPLAKAKMLGAMIYNAQRKIGEAPVTGDEEAPQRKTKQ